MTLAANADDTDLLRRFTDAHCEEAFGELVRRHLNVVHSAAQRQLGGNPAAAADVTQAVFTELAKQANRLVRHPTLVGWLYTTTYRIAARHVREETRRQRRELEAHAMQELLRENPAPEADWNRIQPVLDEAMHDLSEADRLALLLRHFERRPFSEVGAQLGLSENAARMRVDRAIEKLRGRLAKGGITSTAAALAFALGGSAVASAPAGLAASVTTTAVATASLSVTTTGFITLMASTKLKVAVGITLLTAAVGPMLVHHRAYHDLVGENTRLLHEIADLREKVLPVEPAATVTAPTLDLEELLQLRGEVARLRATKIQSASSLAASKLTWYPAGQPPMEAAHLADLGMDTPENASTSLLWAITTQQMNRFVEVVKLPDDIPEDEAAKRYDRLFRQMTNAYARWHFGSVQRTETKDDGTLKLYFQYRDTDTGRSDVLLVLLRKYDSVWKVVIDDVPRTNPAKSSG